MHLPHLVHDLALILIVATLTTLVFRFINQPVVLGYILAGMVVASAQAGFSPALGAFIMGSILSETSKGERIESLVLPVKNLFAAIFFANLRDRENLNQRP